MPGEVAVTGIGAVSSRGRGTAVLWREMSRAEARAPDRPGDPLARMEFPLIHLVPGTPGAAATALYRASSYAVTAAEEAIADAGFGALPDGTSVIIGSCMGEPGLNELGRGAADGWRPQFPLAANVATRLGVFGHALDIANACAAGGFAIGAAVDLISSGEADVVLAGGADAYSRVALGAFNRLGAVDPDRCRPFDRNRAGTVFAEGAGFLVLESAAHARARGVTPALRVAGTGWSCDAGHPTAPDPDGAEIERAMRAALGAHRVGCVIPHATGTPLGDVVESRALHRVLGPDAEEVPVYSLKALLGHAGGAAAALGVVAAALILRGGRVPPNVPVGDQDPECAVLVATEPVSLAVRRVLVNGCGFGGANASVLLEGVA